MGPQIVFALCLLPLSLADDFPIISWNQLSRTPFSAASGSSSPSCIDFDGDTDYDCFLGTASGDVEYYENTGSSTAFIFTRDTTKDITGNQAYSKPTIGDFNGDGYYDFYIGGYDGKVVLLTNNGDNTFTESSDDVFGNAIKKYNSGSSGSLIKGGSGPNGLVSASLMLPLAVTGLVSVGVGTLGSLSVMMQSVEGGSSSSLGTYSSPSCIDMDSDGLIDCVVCYYDGSCALFMNTGTTTEASFKLTLNDMFKNTYDDSRMASPFVKDFDGDGDIDIMVGFDQGEVYYYENIAEAGETSFSRDDFSLLSSDVFGSSSSVNANAAAWCGQTDSDSNVECFVGSENGTAYAYDSELPDPTPAPTSSFKPSMSPTMPPVIAPTISLPPTTGVSPTGDNKPSSNNNNNGVSLGSSGWIIALVVSIVFIIAAGTAVFCNMKKKTGRDAFDEMNDGAGGSGGNGSVRKDDLALFSEPTRTDEGMIKPSQQVQQQQQQQQQQQPGLLAINMSDIQMVTPPPAPQPTASVPPPSPQVMPNVPPPLAMAVRAEEYDEEPEVRVFAATAVKGQSAHFAVAQQAEPTQQEEEEYRSVSDEKYAAKMAQNQPKRTSAANTMYTANEEQRQQSFQQNRLSSVDAMVSDPSPVKSLDEIVKE